VSVRPRREIPPGSGIHGRPILEDLAAVYPHTRHLAFYRSGAWWTWCGQRVPDDHRCPSRQEIEASWPYYASNCETCHRRYRELSGWPWPASSS